jgi:hypothetical protein
LLNYGNQNEIHLQTMTIDLYTPADVSKERQRLYLQQKGVDPILQEKLLLSDSVCDHDHITQHCRAALHRQSNAFEGLVFNAYRRCLQWVTDKPLPDLLRNLADYLEQDYTGNAIHTGWMKRVSTDFNTLKSSQQDELLVALGQQKGKNLVERKKLFLKAIKTKQFSYAAIRSRINNLKGTNK